MQLFHSTPRTEARGQAALPAGRQDPVVADRGEFIDALARLRRGQVLVRPADAHDERCVIEGQMLYASWRPLSEFGLLDELPPQPRQGRMHCYRLSPRGRDFADRAVAEWKRQPLWRRLAMRLGA